MYDPVYCLITAAVLSIDAFAAGVAYGVRGIRFSRLGALVFAAVCLCAVSCGVFAGSLLLFFSFGKRAGGALLTAAGLIMIMQQFSVFMRLPLFELLAAPEKTDFNNNHIIDCREAAVLALVLSMDGSMVCTGSTAGCGGFMLPVCIFVFHLLFLKLGLLTGGRFSVKGCEKVCGITAGLLLVCLGLDGLLN